MYKFVPEIPERNLEIPLKRGCRQFTRLLRSGITFCNFRQDGDKIVYYENEDCLDPGTDISYVVDDLRLHEETEDGFGGLIHRYSDGFPMEYYKDSGRIDVSTRPGAHPLRPDMFEYNQLREIKQIAMNKRSGFL